MLAFTVAVIKYGFNRLVQQLVGLSFFLLIFNQQHNNWLNYGTNYVTLKTFNILIRLGNEFKIFHIFNLFRLTYNITMYYLNTYPSLHMITILYNLILIFRSFENLIIIIKELDFLVTFSFLQFYNQAYLIQILFKIKKVFHDTKINCKTWIALRANSFFRSATNIFGLPFYQHHYINLHPACSLSRYLN